VKIGFLVNPVAGMGGAVGLKGTDGADTLSEAVRRGASRVAPRRAVEALMSLRPAGVGAEFLTCAGDMGDDELREADISGAIVHRPGSPSTSEDTQKAARAFANFGVDIIVFVGGDGTARDVVGVVGTAVPVLGVPAGVKMHSGVFLTTPGELGAVLSGFASDPSTAEVEVMDVDEEMFREGVLAARLYALARVPSDDHRIQTGKAAYRSGTADDEAEEIGRYIADRMEDGVVYILGPGSTTAAVARALGLSKTLLGVDAVLNRRVICPDAAESDLLRILSDHGRAEVVVTPIGAQGFFLGRGNQQISPRVLRALRKEDITVIATPTKLAGTPVLRVDTGDPDLDRRLRGKMKVVTGYRRRRMVDVL